MQKNDLIAPKNYNIMMEMERYAKDPERQALIWKDSNGNEDRRTYAELITNVNKIGIVFLNSGLQLGDKILVMIPRMIAAYEVYLAALKTGIVIIPASEMLKAK